MAILKNKEPKYELFVFAKRIKNIEHFVPKIEFNQIGFSWKVLKMYCTLKSNLKNTAKTEKIQQRN